MAVALRIGLLAVVVLSLLTMSFVAAAAPSDGPERSAHNTSLPGEWRTLSIEQAGTKRTETTSASTDLGAVLARTGDQVQTQQQGATLATRTEALDTDSAKFDVLDEGLQRMEARIDRLRAAEHRAVLAYDGGSIDARDLVVRLARIRSQGTSMNRELNTIRTSGQAIDSRALVARSDALTTQLSITAGPVRERVRRTTAAAATPRRITVLSAGRSVAITSVSGDRYRREVTLPSRIGGAGTVIQLSRAIDIVRKSYPEAYQNRRRIEGAIGGRTSGLYRITVVGGGKLGVFVGIRSRQVFKETRTVPLHVLRGQAPSGPTATNNGVHLTAHRTYQGGPLLVRTTSAGSNTPVNATVILDGTRIGTTGSDGERWSVASGGRTNVTARLDGARVTAPVIPEDPPPLNRTMD